MMLESAFSALRLPYIQLHHFPAMIYLNGAVDDAVTMPPVDQLMGQRKSPFSMEDL